MFNFFVKLIGSGIALVIFFMPLSLDYSDNNITINTELVNPVTSDIHDLIIQGYHFRVNYNCSLIIRGRRVFKETIIKDLSYENGWLLNGEQIGVSEIQQEFGNLQIIFNNLNLTEDEEVIIFIKAEIEEDQIFLESTGLNSSILWENYIPRIKSEYIYQNGVLHEM